MYVVVEPGLTVMLPGLVTPPISLSIDADVAFPTKPHCKVVELPGVMVVADAVKYSIAGYPEQVVGTVIVTWALDV